MAGGRDGFPLPEGMVMRAWRLLDTGALPAALNIGIDQALLHLYARDESPPTLRFYRWSPSAISLGYFQSKHTFDLAACHKMGLDIVRRPTGGQAVLHERDLTYSVIAGVGEGLPDTPASACDLLCKGLLAGFKLLGVEAERGTVNMSDPDMQICFVQFTLGDLLQKGKKFVGNAQIWQGSSLLQQGSIVLEPQLETWVKLLLHDNSASQSLRRRLQDRMTSLKEILGRHVEPEEVKAALVAGMAGTLGIEFQSGKLGSEEWALACDFASEGIFNY